MSADVTAWLEQGEAHLRAGRASEAGAAFVQALRIEPANRPALDRLRGIAQQANRPDLFAPLVLAAWRQEPSRVEWLVEWGGISANRVSLADMISMFEEGVARCPRSAILHERLASLYGMNLRADDAIACCRRAIELDPNLGDARSTLALFLFRRGDTAEAREQSQRAVEINAADTVARCCLGHCLLRAGCLTEALEAFRIAGSARPDLDDPAAGEIQTLVRFGRFEEAAARAVALGRQVGDATQFLAIRWYAHLGAGQHEAARAILDLDKSVQSFLLPTPLGFADSSTFNRMLADALRVNPTLTWEPVGKTTRGGHQTTNLMEGPSLAVQAFLRCLATQIDAYAAVLPADHPFRSRPFRAYGINCWATLLQAGGHQEPHIHSSGLVSGVYYVELPEGMGDADGDGAGCIEFGAPPAELELPFDPPRRRVKPEPGLMVLFPSHTYHRTIPFFGTGQRISVAFDVSL